MDMGGALFVSGDRGPVESAGLRPNLGIGNWESLLVYDIDVGRAGGAHQGNDRKTEEFNHWTEERNCSWASRSADLKSLSGEVSLVSSSRNLSIMASTGQALASPKAQTVFPSI